MQLTVVLSWRWDCLLEQASRQNFVVQQINWRSVCLLASLCLLEPNFFAAAAVALVLLLSFSLQPLLESLKLNICIRFSFDSERLLLVQSLRESKKGRSLAVCQWALIWWHCHTQHTHQSASCCQEGPWIHLGARFLFLSVSRSAAAINSPSSTAHQRQQWTDSTAAAITTHQTVLKWRMQTV